MAFKFNRGFLSVNSLQALLRSVAGVILAGMCMLLIPAGCEKKPEKNTVDIDQLNYDNSSDYKYIFRDEVAKEKWKKNRYKKEKF